jgi:hypothetical protein
MLTRYRRMEARAHGDAAASVRWFVSTNTWTNAVPLANEAVKLLSLGVELLVLDPKMAPRGLLYGLPLSTWQT